MTTWLERMQQMLAGATATAPVAQTVGFRLTDIGEGRAVFVPQPVVKVSRRAETGEARMWQGATTENDED